MMHGFDLLERGRKSTARNCSSICPFARYVSCRYRYTVLSYAAENTKGSKNGSSSSAGRRSGSSKLPGNNKGSSGPEFRHLPLSESTLLVWVYRFDKDDPYRPVPNEAALQFAPTAKPPATKTGQSLDVEAVGRRSGAGAGATVGMLGGPRDTGLLAWLWGADRGDGGGLGGNNGGGAGGVRQHFIGSASWQGKSPATGQGREEEEDDIRRAIALSLAVAPRTDGGVEESKG